MKKDGDPGAGDRVFGGCGELAGHVSLTTTQRYMHLSPAAKESAIRLLEVEVGERSGER